MLLFLKAPTTEYKSLDDIGKFNLIWNVSIVLIPIFLVLGIIHIAYNDTSWVTSLIACGVALSNYIVLLTTKKYKLVAFWSVILSVLIVQASIFIIEDSHLIADTMWCLLSAFFTYFLFGVFAGTSVLMLNLTGIVIYLLNGSEHDVIAKGITVEEVDFRMVLNVFYVAIAMSFVIYKMLDNNKKINERYEQQIQQNEVLMKEIHHRVKNNLQIISSLLKLQSAESDSQVVETHFEEAIGRIRSMALIHEKMYQKEDLAKIDIQSYLVNLVDEITSTLQSETNIEFNVISEIDEINMESIVPVSLIFNELITNSIKHGFADKKNGVIHVEISKGNGDILFEYMDSGEWKAPKKENTFGLELLRTLTDQLEGSYNRELEGGTRYVFIFNADKILP